jgi:hypothetical protein
MINFMIKKKRFIQTSIYLTIEQMHFFKHNTHMSMSAIIRKELDRFILEQGKITND